MPRARASPAAPCRTRHARTARPAVDACFPLHRTRAQWVDWSSEHGLWIPCAGVRTPWQSHLAGEEYEPDARPFAEVGGWACAHACSLPCGCHPGSARPALRQAPGCAGRQRVQAQLRPHPPPARSTCRPAATRLGDLTVLLEGSCPLPVRPASSRLHSPLSTHRPQATSLDELKAALKGGWGDVEGFVRYFGLYPADITLDSLKAAFK